MKTSALVLALALGVASAADYTVTIGCKEETSGTAELTWTDESDREALAMDMAKRCGTCAGLQCEANEHECFSSVLLTHMFKFQELHEDGVPPEMPTMHLCEEAQDLPPDYAELMAKAHADLESGVAPPPMEKSPDGKDNGLLQSEMNRKRAKELDAKYRKEAEAKMAEDEKIFAARAIEMEAEAAASRAAVLAEQEAQEANISEEQAAAAASAAAASAAAASPAAASAPPAPEEAPAAPEEKTE